MTGLLEADWRRLTGQRHLLWPPTKASTLMVVSPLSTLSTVLPKGSDGGTKRNFAILIAFNGVNCAGYATSIPSIIIVRTSQGILPSPQSVREIETYDQLIIMLNIYLSIYHEYS